MPRELPSKVYGPKRSDKRRMACENGRREEGNEGVGMREEGEERGGSMEAAERSEQPGGRRMEEGEGGLKRQGEGRKDEQE